MRIPAAALVVLLALGYTAAVLSGDITPERQLSATHLALLIVSGIAAAVMTWPASLRHIKSFSAGGLQVELELQRIQEDQADLRSKQREQEAKLQLLEEIFPLLLPENELRHIQNLEARERDPASAVTGSYHGSNALREELRRLRYMGLIEVAMPHRRIAEVPDSVFDLGDYVALTDRGRHWMRRADELARLDPAEKAPDTG